MSRRNNRLVISIIRFKTQATNTSTTTTNYVNVSCDWLTYNMASLYCHDDIDDDVSSVQQSTDYLFT